MKYIFQSILLLSVPAHFLSLQRQLASPNWPNSPLGCDLLQAAHNAKYLKAQIKLLLSFPSLLDVGWVMPQSGPSMIHDGTNPNQQRSGANPVPPANFCSLEFTVEKTTP